MGKSTLTKAIVEKLSSNNIAARFVEEHDVLEIPELQGYVEQVHQGNANDYETLTVCCEKYIQRLMEKLPEIAVIDSLLPCWDWLSEACSTDEIARFSETLYLQLKPLNPLLIVVDGDVSLGLSRAIADRGETWALKKAEQRTAVRQVDAYLNYLLQLRETMEQNLPSWPFKMVRVNTTNQELAQATQSTMAEILF